MLEKNQNNELDTSPSVIKVAQLVQTLSGTLRLMHWSRLLVVIITAGCLNGCSSPSCETPQPACNSPCIKSLTPQTRYSDTCGFTKVYGCACPPSSDMASTTGSVDMRTASVDMR